MESGATSLILSAMQAGVLPPCKGGPHPLSGEVLATSASAAAAAPIGIAPEQIFAFGQSQEHDDERFRATRATPSMFSSLRSPKKRRSDEVSMIYLSAEGVNEMVEWAVNKALLDFASKQTHDGLKSGIRNVREGMEKAIKDMQAHMAQVMTEAIATMRAEAETRANAMLQTLIEKMSGMILGSMASKNEASDRTKQASTPDVGTKTRASIRQGQQQPTQATQQSWAAVVSTGTQKPSGWTTVTHGKKKAKKLPLDQRRILFARNVQTHTCDPRDVMFEVNKALAHARADVTVRVIKMGYTEKGNLTGVMGENACAEDLFAHAQAVMAVVQKLDPEVVYMTKTEKWCRLRVHGVALDRYMTEGGLDLARKEIELMTGEQLPYAPRWIKGDTLGQRYESGTIKRSTLVLTVKNKQAADTIMAKGLSFGGRRHEAERFWERGQGGMCMRCCGRDHFGKCVEEAKCFICAGKHEGSKHECTIESCSKRSEPCEHYAARCANCQGPHQATSKKCPERRASRQKRARQRTEIRSSPPMIETEIEQDDLPEAEY